MEENGLKLLLNEEFNESINKNIENSILMLKTAQEFVDLGTKVSEPKRLFGNLIEQGKLVILFGDSGTNKSTLMVQLCDGISKGIMQLGMECSKGKVILLDGEIDTKEFSKRYLNHKFHRDFLRIEIDFAKMLESNLPLDKLVFESLRSIVEKHHPDLLVIDNLTYIVSGSKEQSKDIIDLLRSVFYFTKKFNTAVVLIGHVPKLEAHRPLLKEHLSGSKVLSDLADTVIGISSSIKHKNIRYIKELKNRGHEIFLDKDNVLVCETTIENGYLQLKNIGFSSEKEHLIDNKTEDLTYEKIMVLKQDGLSNVKIAKQFGVNDKTIGNIIKRNNTTSE